MTTTKQIITAHLAISSLISFDKENKVVLPSAARIKFAQVFRKTREIFEDYINEKNNLVERYGAKNDKTGDIEVTAENKGKFDSEVNSMLEADCKVEIKPLSVKELGENQIPIDVLVALQDGGVIELS